VATAAQLESAWSVEPLVLAGVAVAAILFARAFIRLRRRGRSDHASWSRAALFGTGLAILTLALVSPLDAAGDDDLLSAHMLQHMLIGDAVPALLLLAVRGPLIAFLIPAAAIRFTARHDTVHATVDRLGTPTVAVAIWAAAMAIWHVPALYDAALSRPWLHSFEHASFVFAGFLVWALLIDPAGRRRLSVKGRAAVAGCLFIFGQVMCDVLFLSPTPLYPAYARHAHGLFGLTPLADQQYAGLLMNSEQFVTLGTCVTLLAWSLLQPVRRRPRFAYRASIPREREAWRRERRAVGEEGERLVGMELRRPLRSRGAHRIGSRGVGIGRREVVPGDGDRQ
jgi:putative membrane protein